ncbi:MAG: NAD(P)H-dependent oxidoreductase [Erysipelotrichaceae bacterium]|nr:NAD(P)H-dependent oxidoreductase [Erysipelotrichaceae bacterium]
MSANRKVLFVNACVRPDSRTRQLAQYYLDRMQGEIEEINLERENIQPLNSHTLAQRDQDVALSITDEYTYAHRFAQADEIVLAAPYWDYSYPASVKAFIEAVNCYGITFRYENDKAVGLCRAERLVYIQTAGGLIGRFNFGYDHVKALCQTFYGIKEVVEFRAEGLDLEDSDSEKLVNKAKKEIEEYFRKQK